MMQLRPKRKKRGGEAQCLLRGEKLHRRTVSNCPCLKQQKEALKTESGVMQWRPKRKKEDEER